MTNSIRAALLTYLDRHVGQIVSLGDIVAATGLTPSQVQSNLSNIRNARTDTGFDMAASLSVVTAGQQWIWRPVPSIPKPANATPPGKRMFEEVGTTRDGAIILQCEQGKIFKAVEL